MRFHYEICREYSSNGTLERNKFLSRENDCIAKIDKLRQQLEKPLFKKGSLMALVNSGCDDFDETERVYEFIGVVTTINSIEVNSIIVKQVEGDRGMIFSLTKDDCKEIGIEYEPCLQLFPYNMNWQVPKKIKKEIEEEIKKVEAELSKIRKEKDKIDKEKQERIDNKKRIIKERLDDANKEMDDTIKEMKRFVSSQRRAFIELNIEDDDYLNYSDYRSKYIDDDDYRYLNDNDYNNRWVL